MSFFRDCYESMRGNIRNFMSTPLSRQKLYIFGGVFIALLLLVIILVVSLHSSSSGDSPQGSSVLNDGPGGSSNIDPSKLKNYVVQGLKDNSTEILNTFNLSNITSSHLVTTIWPAGASSCGANQKDAIAQTLEIIDVVKRVVQKVPNLSLVSDSQGLSDAKSNDKIGVVISLDGGYTIDSRLSVLRMFKSLGASVFTLTGACSVPWVVSGTNTTTTNLTQFGTQIVTEASRLGLLLDLTYSSPTVVETVVKSEAPAIIFNGVGALSLTNNTVNLSNDTLKIIKDKGVVLVGFDCAIINTTDNCTIGDVIKHLNFIAEVTGTKKTVGLSLNFSSPSLPSDLKSPQDVGVLLDQLQKDNWSLDELRGLAYDNFLSAWKKALDYANKKIADPPVDVLETETELDSSNKTNLVCYSDLSIRYNTNQPTAPPPTVPTTEATKAPPPTTEATKAPPKP
ncbi:Dipeptidase [Nesidiocoris tenuis]|uniref:Dipeptidase n=2 Tax=Nesidiocoris tenuis TaxID=355587 RepID=A0ABN7BAE4_9HEMI|nr:Dipeptidase [Nesidiocoris tenuis]